MSVTKNVVEMLKNTSFVIEYDNKLKYIQINNCKIDEKTIEYYYKQVYSQHCGFQTIKKVKNDNLNVLMQNYIDNNNFISIPRNKIDEIMDKLNEMSRYMTIPERSFKNYVQENIVKHDTHAIYYNNLTKKNGILKLDSERRHYPDEIMKELTIIIYITIEEEEESKYEELIETYELINDERYIKDLIIYTQEVWRNKEIKTKINETIDKMMCSDNSNELMMSFNFKNKVIVNVVQDNPKYTYNQVQMLFDKIENDIYRKYLYKEFEHIDIKEYIYEPLEIEEERGNKQYTDNENIIEEVETQVHL